jgi:anti-sigma-K factor RskA
VSGQVLGFTGSAHQVAFELLPWFVNGTLDAGERAQVEQHLHDCPACRRECAWLQQLAAACSEDEVQVDASRAFARLAPRLTGDGEPCPRSAARPGRTGLLAWWGASRGAWLRFAVALQLGVIVTLGAVLVAGIAPAYRTLGARQDAAPAAGTVIVVFDAATPERELRRILRDAGARIVDGPTVTGAYVLDVDGPPETRATALARLRAEHAVTLAEPLTTEPAR